MEAGLVRGFAWGVMAIMLFAIAPAAAAPRDGAPLAAADGTRATVRVVLKFVKRGAGAGLRLDPKTCAACTLVSDANWNADNARETVIALEVPRMRSLELGFTGSVAGIRRVILESDDVAFRRDGDRLVVALPPLPADAITAAEVATHIVEPGMVLRFEHADPARRAGDYATGPFPVIARRAADTLEFAQREVVRELGLGDHVERAGLGRILREIVLGAGLTVMPGMSPSAQAYAEGAVKRTIDQLQKGKRPPLQAGLVLTDTHNGDVLAVIGSSSTQLASDQVSGCDSASR